MNKKVFLIGEAYGSYRTQNLVKFLMDHNYQIYYNSFKVSLFSGASGAKRLLRILIRIIYEALKMPQRLFNLLLADYVILTAMSNNNRLSQIELRVADWCGKHIITDFYISIYDTLVRDRQTIKKGTSSAGRLFTRDKNSIELADKVLFLNNAEKKYYLSLLNLDESVKGKYKIVPLCVDRKRFCSLDYYKGNDLGKVFNVCWWGTYIPLHGLDKIIESAQILENNYDLKFHYHLFGNSKEKSKPYLEYISKLNVNHLVTIHNDKTFANGKLEPFLVEHCSLVLGNFGDSKKAKKVLVNKLIDGIAMKAPVLTGESEAPKEFFAEGDIFFSISQAKHIAEKIYEISLLSEDHVKSVVEKSLSIYEESFSPKAFYKRVRGIFEH